MHKAMGPGAVQHSDSSAESVCRTIVVTRHCPPAMKKRELWRIEQFHLVRKLGSGYASTVYLATCRQTGNQVAIKMYHKTKLSELNHYQVQREVRIHCNLEHQHIVQLWAAFEDQYGIYLATEFASKGDVFTEVERRGGQMSEADAVKQVIHPFLLALDYLHGIHIIHRDIKPENLLFTATGVLKVGDFGLSIDYHEERPVTRVGTLDYMAPEVVVCPDKHRPQDHKELTHLHYTSLVDSWAIGVLAYELIVGRPPFDKGHKKATIAEILNGDPLIPPWMSDGAAHFIRWALTKEHSKRPSVVQLAQHPWVLHHVNAPKLNNRRLIDRTDSYVEPRAVGIALNREGTGPEELIRHLQTQAVQTGRFLGKSNSLNAMDGLRYRDFDNPANALGATGFTPPGSQCSSPTGSSSNLSVFRTDPATTAATHDRPWPAAASPVVATAVIRTPSMSRLKPHEAEDISTGTDSKLSVKTHWEPSRTVPAATSPRADAMSHSHHAAAAAAHGAGPALYRSLSSSRMGNPAKDVTKHPEDSSRAHVQKSKSFYTTAASHRHSPFVLSRPATAAHSNLHGAVTKMDAGAGGDGKRDLDDLRSRSEASLVVQVPDGSNNPNDLKIRSYKPAGKDTWSSWNAGVQPSPPSPLSRGLVRSAQSFTASTVPSTMFGSGGGTGAVGSPSRWLHRLSRTDVAECSMDGEGSAATSPTEAMAQSAGGSACLSASTLMVHQLQLQQQQQLQMQQFQQQGQQVSMPNGAVNPHGEMLGANAEGDMDMTEEMNCDENPDHAKRNLIKGAKGLFSSFKKVFS